MACVTVPLLMTTGADAKNHKKSKSGRPNIILILADDMGWGDVGYHGFKDIMTPNIDALAATGTSFSQGYVTSSVSGPSRAGIMTGINQQRFAYYGNSLKCQVPLTQPTIAERVKTAGYKTGMVGKWHLSEDDEHAPEARGFDSFYGFRNGSHDYYRSSTDPHVKNYDLQPVYRNSVIQPPFEKTGAYMTEKLADEAIDFIDKTKGDPYFLFVSFNAVHYPWQVPESYVDRLKNLPVLHEDRRVFAGMVLAMDDAIGRILDKAWTEDERENTLIFFLTDNGSPRGQGIEVKGDNRQKDRGQTTMSSPGTLRGFKGDVYEGGFRVPFLINWKGRVPEGEVYSYPVSSLDIAATIASITGTEKMKTGHELEGTDIIPYVRREKSGRPHELLFWRRDNDFAVRKGDWKLEYNDQGSTYRIQLFNLAEDPDEYYDLSDKMPEKANELINIFDAWENTNPDYVHKNNPENMNREYVNGYRRDVKSYNDELRKKTYSRIDLRQNK